MKRAVSLGFLCVALGLVAPGCHPAPEEDLPSELIGTISEGAGIQFAAGNFDVLVRYEDLDTFPDGLSAPIRDPRQALFDTIQFVQTNADALKSRNVGIAIGVTREIYQRKVERTGVGVSAILGDEKKDREIVRFWADKDYIPIALRAVAQFLKVGTVPPASDTITIYRCKSRKCQGYISFGPTSFGGEETGYAILCASNCKQRKVVVHRKDMTRYFETLPASEDAPSP
jgi:hypothetical protein